MYLCIISKIFYYIFINILNGYGYIISIQIDISKHKTILFD